MILKYGNFTHPVGTTRVTTQRQALLTDAGTAWAEEDTWNITVWLISHKATDAARRADIKAQMSALQAAYSVSGRDLIFCHPNGAETHLTLKTADTLAGVQIISPPHFPDPGRASLVTNCQSQIVAKAIIPYPVGSLSLANQVKSFQETVQWPEAGMQRGAIDVLIGPAVEQTLRQYTAVRATQQGSAVGLYGYPPIPLPIWPSKLASSVPLVTEGTPRRVASDGKQAWIDWPISWTYNYVSSSSLYGRARRLGYNYP